jgi:hypothetical protein
MPTRRLSFEANNCGTVRNNIPFPAYMARSIFWEEKPTRSPLHEPTLALVRQTEGWRVPLSNSTDGQSLA